MNDRDATGPFDAEASARLSESEEAALAGRRVVLGISGGIATYKLATVVSALAQAGAEVTVAMTESATRFVAPLTFQALSGRRVLVSPWEDADAADPQHIAVARSAECMLIAPCTMDALARLAAGRADDMVTLLAASIDRTRTPVLVAPSMNDAMWRQPATQRNLRTLAEDGYALVEPEAGWQACRTIGMGRLAAPSALIAALAAALRDRAAG
ncbi:MAG TPA: flavoprotein [Phycisphaerales bacterium]|nr:flavoprotein [Phycisphaerales bacterium]HMP38090.1 flavoprotein [Phycisphaerales bacterium]